MKLFERFFTKNEIWQALVISVAKRGVALAFPLISVYVGTQMLPPSQAILFAETLIFYSVIMVFARFGLDGVMVEVLTNHVQGSAPAEREGVLFAASFVVLLHCCFAFFVLTFFTESPWVLGWLQIPLVLWAEGLKTRGYFLGYFFLQAPLNHLMCWVSLLIIGNHVAVTALWAVLIIVFCFTILVCLENARLRSGMAIFGVLWRNLFFSSAEVLAAWKEVLIGRLILEDEQFNDLVFLTRFLPVVTFVSQTIQVISLPEIHKSKTKGLTAWLTLRVVLERYQLISVVASLVIFTILYYVVFPLAEVSLSVGVGFGLLLLALALQAPLSIYQIANVFCLQHYVTTGNVAGFSLLLVCVWFFDAENTAGVLVLGALVSMFVRLSIMIGYYQRRIV